jgi:hypothetical protein
MNEALSKFYGQPVEAGYLSSGHQMVWQAGDTTAIVAGGMGGEIAPAVRAVIAANAALQKSIDYLLE